jgi:hypothetical protein
MIQLREFPKLCHSQAGITAAYKFGLGLQEKGWMRYPAASWDKPAILAFDGEKCVGGINYVFDEDDLTVNVNFAFCAPSHPLALNLLLRRFRSVVRDTAADEIQFTCHAGNEQMARAVKLLGLKPSSMSFRMPVRRPTPPSTKRGIWQSIISAITQ